MEHFKLNSHHQHFIQFMLHNGQTTLDEALAFCEKFKPVTTALFDTLLTEINRVICNHSFKIVKTTCEVTNGEVVVWLNTKNDEISRKQAAFTASELEYFHIIMSELILSDEHSLTYPRCINISSTLKSSEILSRKKGCIALEKWIESGYFVKKKGLVFLGPRTILEFTTYLRSNCDNCTCGLCAELVFWSRNCGSCQKKFHAFCIGKYLKNQKSCPNCSETWQIEESADEESDNDSES